MRLAPNALSAATDAVEPIDTPTPARLDSSLCSLSAAATPPQNVSSAIPDDEVIETRRHDLVDCGNDALTHVVHVLEERLFGGERTLLDGHPPGVIGDAARA